MAHTEHLPIYKAAYDLCLWLEQVVRGFPRYHKDAIGSDLREGSRRILRLVVRANARTDKTSVLLELREQVEELKAMLRLCYDAKGFAGMAAFEHGARLVVDIARQNEGWMRSAQRKSVKTPDRSRSVAIDCAIGGGGNGCSRSGTLQES